MIEARMPDGTVLRFPAGTPDDVVDRAAQEHIAQATRTSTARQANSGVGGFIDGAVRQLAQGATFGLMDEGAAAIRTGAGLWGNYGEALAQERARDETFRADNPVTAGVANVAGGIAGPGRAIGALRELPRVASTAARFLNSGLARGTAAGAAGGALAGAGEGEGVAGRLGGAVTGGATGGVLGGALGAGLTAGGQIGGRVMDTLGLRNPQLAADRQVLRALDRDGVDVATLGRPQQGPGIPPPGPTTLADMGGRNTVNLAAAASNTPGAAQQAADDLVQSRRLSRPDRIASAVDDGLGGGGGTRVADEVEALRRQRTTQAGPLYQSAFSQDAPDTPALRRIMSQPVVQRAAADSMRLQQMEAAARGEAFEPNAMQMLDAAKRGLDEQIGATLDPVTNRVIPGRGAENRALVELRDALLREVDAVPEYAAARAAWAGPTQSMGAMGQGRQALGMDPDVVRGIAARLSPSDLQFFQLGVGRAITDVAGDPAKATTMARRLVEDANMQRRLAAAIPDPAQRAQFRAALQREVEMSAVERAVSPRAGSQTARLQAGQDDMAVDPPGGLMAALLTGNTRGAIGQGAAALYRRTQGINSSTADALAERLLNPDGTANAETVRRLLQRRTTDSATAQQRAGLMAALLRGTGVAAALEVND